MRLSSFLSAILLAAGISSSASSSQDVRRKATSRGCKILLAHFLHTPDTDMASFQDHRFDCELDPSDAGGIAGIIHPINFSDTQRKEMLRKYKKGEVQPSSSILVFKEGSVELGDGAINVAPTADLTASVAAGEPLPSIASKMEGDKRVLIVRVTDKDGQVVPRSAAEVGDDVLGTLGDSVNPQSQLKACSFDKLRLYGSAVEGQSALAVIDVTINVSNQNDDTTVRNAVTTAVTTMLGSGSYPNDFDYVLYVLHSAQYGNWAGYAYLNWYLSVYQGPYSSYNGVLMHELGHNFGLKHSGEGTTEYTDYTCVMGAPTTHYQPDGARMCYNGAKSWQLGWYVDKEAELTKDNTPWFGNLVGLANFDTASSGVVGIKLQRFSSSIDYYIQFNHAVGINIDNGEYINEVVIVEQGWEGSSPAQSWIKAHLSTGQTYSFSNFDNSGQTMSVTVDSINTDAVAGFASLSICLGPCSTPPPIAPTPPPIAPTPPPIAPTPPPIAPTPPPIAPTPPPIAPTPPPIAPTPPPIAPTNPPTPPTRPPTTPTRQPVVPPTPLFCKDSKAVFQKRKNSRPRKCFHVGNNMHMCDRSGIASFCPDTCGKCEEFGCADATVPFKFNNKERKRWTCKKLKEKNNNFIQKKCGQKKFATTCRETCGMCERD